MVKTFVVIAEANTKGASQTELENHLATLGYKVKVVEVASRQQNAHDFNLTPREGEVLKLISKGHSNERIANLLFLSVNTVKNHVSKVISKLNVKDRIQAALMAEKIIL